MSALRELSAAFPDRDAADLARVLEAHDGRGDLAARALLAEALGTAVEEDADPSLESAHARADHLADHLAGTDADPTLSPRARVDFLDLPAAASASPVRHPLGEVATPPRSPAPGERARGLLATERRWSSKGDLRVRDPDAIDAPSPAPSTPADSHPDLAPAPARVHPRDPPGFHPADEIARGWEALRAPLAALFLDEPAPQVRRHVAAMANKSNRHARHARAVTFPPHSPARRRDAASRPVGSGPESPSRGAATSSSSGDAGEVDLEAMGEKVGAWFKDLWTTLVEDDDDEDADGWRDDRRGRGGTPSGAADLRDVEDGQEMEMELVMSPEEEPSDPTADARLETPGTNATGTSAMGTGTPTTNGRTPGSGSGSGSKPGLGFGSAGSGGLFGSSSSLADDFLDASGDSADAHARAHLPDVFPGVRPEASSGTKTDADALEAHRLWGNPGRFVSRDDCASALEGLPEAAAAMRACDAATRRFNFEYDTPPGMSAEERLLAWRGAAGDLCRGLLRALLACGGRFDSCATTPKHRESLLNAVEGYVMGSVQGKVLDGISRTFADDDAAFEATLARVERLPPEALGLKQSHLAAVDQHATASLRSVSRLSCPRHMATAVCDVMRHLAQNCARLRTWAEEERAERRRRKRAAAEGSESGGASTASGVKDAESGTRSDGSEDEEDTPDSVPGTDDLLSLLVVLVARARPARAVSLAAYMDGFHALVGAGHKGELGFALANFLGAVQYVRSEQMRELLARWEGKGEAEAGEQPASPGSPHAIA